MYNALVFLSLFPWRSLWLFTICKLCHWLHVKDVYSFLQMCVFSRRSVDCSVLCLFTHICFGENTKNTKFFSNRQRGFALLQTLVNLVNLSQHVKVAEFIQWLDNSLSTENYNIQIQVKNNYPTILCDSHKIDSNVLVKVKVGFIVNSATCTAHTENWSRVKVLAHWVRNLRMRFFVFVILSYQNACYGCENAENRTWSEFFYSVCNLLSDSWCIQITLTLTVECEYIQINTD